MQAGPMFGQIKNVIVIVDNIMIVSKKANHSDQDHVYLNYDKLQYKMQEVDFLENHIK